MFLLLERRQTIQKNNRINYCKYMVRNFFFLLIILFVSGCKFFDRNITNDKIPLARVDNNYLYIEDIIFSSLQNDSSLIIEKQTDQWIRNQLLLKSAYENVININNVENQVLQYKNNLILFEYEKITYQNNIEFLSDIEGWLKTIDTVIEIEKYNIPNTLIEIATENIPEEPFSYETWDSWTKTIIDKTGLKGRSLFMPLRLILTGKDKGPELKNFLPLLDKETLLRKFGKI